MTMEEVKKPYVAGPNAVDISPSGDGGVLKEIIKPGSGEYTPTAGCKVTVHYTGTLLDGTVFDSSKDRNSPFDFNLGKGQVIKAWDIGVATMKKGEVAMLTCKSEYAYGKTGSPPKIPADATLVFEVEVLSWQAEDLSPKKDGGILRQVLQPGEGHATPTEGSAVQVHLVCEYEGKIIEERDVSFCLGEGSESGIPSGVERALEKFKLKEKSKLDIKSQYAWGKEGKPELKIPPNTDLTYIVRLTNFEKAKESWTLTSSEKLEQAKFFKDKGTNYFKSGNYRLALKMYKKMIDYVEFDSGFEENEETERQSVLTAARLNSALCYLKLEEFTEAREQCDSALAQDPDNEKGLFRRGQAFLGLSEPEKALLDFEAVIRVDPTNKAASNLVKICNQKLKEQKVKEKKIYANMFEKFAQRDREEKDWRFGWWDGKSVEVQKMEEKPEEEKVDEKELRLQEHREFIRQMKERKERLEAQMKAQNIKLDEETEEENKTDTELVEKGDIKNNEKVEETSKEEPNSEVQFCGTSEMLSTEFMACAKIKAAVVGFKKEEEEKKKQPDVMKTLGEWGQEEREREPTDFEKENPNILMLEGTGDFKNM